MLVVQMVNERFALVDAQPPHAPGGGDSDGAHNGRRPYFAYPGEGLEQVKHLKPPHRLVITAALDDFRY